MKSLFNEVTGIEENIFSINTTPLREKLELMLECHLQEKYDCDPTAILLGCISQIEDRMGNTSVVLDALLRMTTALENEIPHALRPRLLARLNRLTLELKRTHQSHNDVFKNMFMVYSVLKTQLDNNPQDDDILADKEWQMIEDSVYTFCDWEDAISNEIKA